MRLTISKDQRHFERDGKPFIWQGDTVWSAFTNPTYEQWEEYLDYRKAQGYNVLMINTLPQWDRCMPDQGIYPFARNDINDALDPSTPFNEAYAERSQKLCQMAVEKGFTLALVVTWCTVIPGTWLNHIHPAHTWSLEAVLEHTRRVVKLYEQFEPVYVVSGDTDLVSDETFTYYKESIKLLRELAPEALLTMHIAGFVYDLPECFGDHLDFITYQSGHQADSIDRLEMIPGNLRKRYPNKPLLNAEPCYERMAKLPPNMEGPITGMYEAEDVIEAMRRSLAAGADAGISYGANGLWGWNQKSSDEPCEGLAKDWYGKLLNWKDAMMLPGAGQVKELLKN